jgi:hypothetical protein
MNRFHGIGGFSLIGLGLKAVPPGLNESTPPLPRLKILPDSVKRQNFLAV